MFDEETFDALRALHVAFVADVVEGGGGGGNFSSPPQEEQESALLPSLEESLITEQLPTIPMPWRIIDGIIGPIRIKDAVMIGVALMIVSSSVLLAGLRQQKKNRSSRSKRRHPFRRRKSNDENI